jgi:hypothetical protein
MCINGSLIWRCGIVCTMFECVHNNHSDSDTVASHLVSLGETVVQMTQNWLSPRSSFMDMLPSSPTRKSNTRSSFITMAMLNFGSTGSQRHSLTSPISAIWSCIAFQPCQNSASVDGQSLNPYENTFTNVVVPILYWFGSTTINITTFTYPLLIFNNCKYYYIHLSSIDLIQQL